MLPISSEVSNEIFESLQKLAKENHRELSQEISYRLDQAIRYKKYLSDQYEDLFKMLLQVYEEDHLDKGVSVSGNIKCVDKALMN